MTRVVVLSALAMLLAGGVAAQTGDRGDRLIHAREEAVVARAQAGRLIAAAGAANEAAARAAAQRQDLAVRVARAGAALRIAEVRAARANNVVVARRARLAAEQAPVARLLAALQSLARRPTLVAVMQPGSIDDLVHVRAVLDSVMPVVEQRTAAMRAELRATRELLAQAMRARNAVIAARTRYDRGRAMLAQIEVQHRERAAALGRGALSEQDRALALSEQARDLVDRLAEEGQGQTIVAGLSALAGPVPRPVASVAPVPVRGVYRLPVAGRLLTGFGEISDAGVRSRGLTFAVPAGRAVVAPAGGVVRYAQGFRGYGGIVILDHGHGWTSLVTGLAKPLTTTAGATVRMGDPIGRVAPATSAGDDPRVMVELRRWGQPVDAVAMIR